MPLSRHKVGNEYALGGRDLYRAADQHDPEAVLDGVAMAGLVGVLRQLGDLAEFAAQVFHGLYDEVMSTSARGHGLMLRVQQLEAELPLLEKDSCHRDYLYVASNKGVEWHTNPSLDHGVVTTGDTPRFIMESIKQCRGPPKLFMLDKYDIGGEGACLKRYTDPSFFKTDSACSSILQEGIHRERRPLRAMEIRPNLQNEEIFRPPRPANTDSKLESDSSGQALGEVPTRRRQLKYRQRNGSVFQNFRPHMQNLNDKVSSEEKLLTVDSPETNSEERDIMVDTSIDMDKLMGDRFGMVCKNRSTISEEALSRSSDARSAGSSKEYNSEVEIYVDALTTMDSEVETDTEHRNQGHRAFVRMDSNNTCSDANNAMASRSSSFERKDLLDVASESGDVNDQHEEANVSTPQAKPVPGEHERTSSLEELFTQEKPASCDHERTSSLEDLLMEDGHASGEQATDWSCNGIVSNTVSNVTQDITKNAKEAKENSNVATISFKKIASKRSKYVGGMELIASKVGILPRKLSKKHDPFSDSLRSMAKQLLELKYDGTQDTELYEFEDNDVGLDVKCLEMYSPVEINESAMQRIPSDSPHDDVSLRECHQEEVSHKSEHDLPPTDSPQDSVPDDGNGFEDSHIHYLIGMSSPIFLEEEAYVGTECDEHSATPVVNHILDHAEEKIEEHADREVAEDTRTEVTSENASDMGENSKEASICAGQVNGKDINERNEYDAYMSDDEDIEHIQEQVVSDDMISSPVSSKQSDNPCQITPLILSYADDKIACKESDSYTPEAHNITLSETLMTVDLTKMISETETASEAAIPDNEQYYPEGAFGQDIAVSSNEVGCQIEQLTLCNLSTVPLLDSSVKTEENHELHWAVHQEIRSARNSSTEVLGDPLALDSRDVPVPVISSFDWMLNGTMHKSFNVLPSQPTYGNVEVSGSSEDIQDPPPLPPLPPMQWRTNKLQTGSSALSAKSGRPPRPKPPVKHQESDDNSSLDVRNKAAAIVQESSLHNDLSLQGKMVQPMVQEGSLHDGLSLQDEMVQPMVSNEHEANKLVSKDSQVNHVQEGDKEYVLQDSNSFSPSEVTRAPSDQDENELIVIPEEAWSEFGDIKLIADQDGKQQLSIGFSGCNGGMHTAGLSTEKTIEKHQAYVDHKEREFLAVGSKKVTDSEENKPNGALKLDGILDPDLPAQLDDSECSNSGDKSREVSTVLEEEPSMSLTHSVPRPPRYPLLPVTSHDRSMAPTLVQPSSKLSDEKNNILEQIKNKSFNLKPVLAKRPNVMGGPRTNLQVVAILERAHAIRQAVADDDDEEDSWSE
ncbi:hypothetical protein PR202_ga26026 [Eleusine coracana subsp. coracana]|uniref:Protein SCAR n=1 Tax=Eleusine coracana subsp. coracana TaxID=191504 RepID=A0AAV5DCU9_ELECO|nr:hypothetical protein PR202_ga26026 [Eleusine coracana subsp. coracana]